MSWEMLTIPESATDSCEDSEGDLHVKPACASKVDVKKSENLTGCRESSQLSVLAMLEHRKS